jgi:hypothetical protein
LLQEQRWRFSPFPNHAAQDIFILIGADDVLLAKLRFQQKKSTPGTGTGQQDLSPVPARVNAEGSIKWCAHR